MVFPARQGASLPAPLGDPTNNRHGIALAIGLVIAVLPGRVVTGRVIRLSAALGRLAQRDDGFALKEVVARDELGAMARALHACREGLQEADRFAAAQAPAAGSEAERGARVAGQTNLLALNAKIEAARAWASPWWRAR